MNRRDDVNKLYIMPNKIQLLMKIVFIVNTISSIVALLVKTDNLLNMIFIMQILASIIYVCLKLLDDNVFWYKAERIRRQNAIENGFGLDISEYKTKNYYNNNFPDDVVKFSVNEFESILFSMTTASKMLLRQSIITIIAIIAFISACIIYKDYNVILIISQTVFSAYFIEELITLTIYKYKLEGLYNDFYRELITIGVKDKNQKSLLLAYSIEYETIKAHYKVRLSEKEFKKHNSETSIKWNDICRKIKIS